MYISAAIRQGSSTDQCLASQRTEYQNVILGTPSLLVLFLSFTRLFGLLLLELLLLKTKIRLLTLGDE